MCYTNVVTVVAALLKKERVQIEISDTVVLYDRLPKNPE